MKTFVLNEKVILPARIKVRIFRGESGAWIAEVPRFDLSTESHSLFMLEDLLNDMLFVYFDVPKEYRNSIKYVPEKPKSEIEIKNKLPHLLFFRKFISSNLVNLVK